MEYLGNILRSGMPKRPLSEGAASIRDRKMNLGKVRSTELWVEEKLPVCKQTERRGMWYLEDLPPNLGFSLYYLNKLLGGVVNYG